MMKPSWIRLTIVPASMAFALAFASCSGLGPDGAAAGDNDLNGDDGSQKSAAGGVDGGPVEEVGGPVDPDAAMSAGDGDPVVAALDGEASDPVGSQEPLHSAAMGPDEAEACAAVELGYLELLQGKSGNEVDAYLVQGAQAALDTDDVRYSPAGQTLLSAVATADAFAAADALLGLCAEDGFERLA